MYFVLEQIMKYITHINAICFCIVIEFKETTTGFLNTGEDKMSFQIILLAKDN